MNMKRRKAFTAVAALLLFSVSQIGLQIGLAEPKSPTTPVVPQQIVARLATRDNKPIIVNGQPTGAGTSILSGATIETASDQSATVNVGPLGSVDIAPNTKVVLTFEQGKLNAQVIYGCVILTARKNTAGEITTEKGSIGKTDANAGGVLEMCFPQGAAAPVVGPGVAQGAGATAGTGGGATTAGGGGLFGLGVPATIAVVTAATVAGLTPLFFPDSSNNPSPAAP
jgi:hypothetical protein